MNTRESYNYHGNYGDFPCIVYVYVYNSYLCNPNTYSNTFLLASFSTSKSLSI